MRSLPPQFLLPAWSTRQLAKAVKQRNRTVHSNPPPSDQRAPFAGRTQDSNEDAKRPGTSLFELLFPEETVVNKRPVEKQLGRLPVFKWDQSSTEKASTKETNHGGMRDDGNMSRRFAPLHQPTENIEAGRRVSKEKVSAGRTSVLILGAASKTLEESDFFRLSPKGEHIEGWTSGITKGMGKHTH